VTVEMITHCKGKKIALIKVMSGSYYQWMVIRPPVKPNTRQISTIIAF